MIKYNPNGLSEAEVLRSRAEHGENRLTPPKDNSAWELLAEKFCDPIIRILLVAALFSLTIGIIEGDLTESIGIISAILLATLVGFAFEWDAQRRFRRLNQVNDETPVKVMRDGELRLVPRHEIVVGDLVYLEHGETVPADGELVESVSLRINESTLTGEPETEKSADPEQQNPEATYPSNMALRGTTVTDGYGRLVITAVGDQSEAGRVTEQATATSGEQTPLNRQLERLSKLIGKVGIALSVAIFAILLTKAFLFEGLGSREWIEIAEYIVHLFMVAVAIIVMAVPEGLPMSITLSLAMSMRRMLRTNNLVRKMHACETMGAVTVICTDKTGTLTQNRMSVSEMVRYDAQLDDRTLGELIALNSTAFLDREGNVLGNSTEGALLQWMHQNSVDYAALRNEATIVNRQTFSTHTKYMATVLRSGITGKQLISVKGAPEIVLQMCDTADHRTAIEQQLALFQHRAMRTLAIAWGETSQSEVANAIAEQPLRLAAIVAIADPIREEVPAAVGECLDAGITVKIVTGDTAATATEIARQIGLWNEAVDGERNRMTGPEFAAASDEELLERIDDLKILSRARPLDKQRLVQLLQRKGEVVAVTGDGTNDAPALNFANVGLSMGSGTAVAKDASDITLLDDSFASIATAVMWGRSLYRNIQRFVLFQLTINFVAIVICFVSALIGSELPLTVVQILWVNIIMDTFAAMAMASLPPSREVMKDKPRQRNDFIISKRMARMIVGSGSVMIVALLGMLFYWGEPTMEQLTIFFTTFVFMQFWNMFNAKGFEARHSSFTHLKGCREFFLILALIFAGQLLIIYCGGEVFRCVPLSTASWATLFAATSLLAIGGDLLMHGLGAKKR